MIFIPSPPVITFSEYTVGNVYEVGSIASFIIIVSFFTKVTLFGQTHVFPHILFKPKCKRVLRKPDMNLDLKRFKRTASLLFQMTVELKNVTTVLRPVRAIPPKTSYFSVGLGI